MGGSSEVPNEFKLNSCPTDGISAVKFAPNTSQFLLASSWDCTVRLYDITENTQRFKYSHSAPVLDCCFSVCSCIYERNNLVLLIWTLP